MGTLLDDLGRDASWLLIGLAVVAAVWLVMTAVRRERVMAARLGAARDAATQDRAQLLTAAGDADGRAAFDPAMFAAGRAEPLASAWHEVGRALLRTPDGPRLARDPRDIFNGDLLYGPAIDMRRFDALPNLLVGVGLGLTFTLLAATIVIGALALQSEPERLTAAIGTLLWTSGAKFVTSIAGIASSVWFIRRKNRLVVETEAALAGLADALVGVAPAVTAPALLSAMSAQAADQTELMRRRGMRQAEAIAAAMRQELERGLTLALTPIADRMTDLSQRVADVNAKQLEMMAAAFARDLGVAVERYTRALAEQMEQAVDRFAEVPPAIAAASGAFREATDAAAAHLRGSASAAAEGYGRLDERLRGLSAELEGADARVARALAGFRDEIDELGGGVREATDAMRQAAPAADRLRATAPSLDAAAASLDGVAAALGRAAAGLERATELVTGGAARLTPELQAWRDGLDAIDAGLARVLDKAARLAPSGGQPAADAVRDAAP